MCCHSAPCATGLASFLRKPAGYRYLLQDRSETGNPDYYGGVQDAVDAVIVADANYEYVAVYVEATVTIAATVKIKPMNEARVDVYPSSDEFSVATSASVSGVITYTVTNNPKSYTWNGQGSQSSWEDPDSWLFGAGNVAKRYPGAGDDVAFASASSVNVLGNITVKSISVSDAVILSNYSVGGVTLSTTPGGIVLTTKNASITVSNVTLSPTPTQTVDDKAKVLAVDNGDGTTTYKVVYGTIFSVW